MQVTAGAPGIGFRDEAEAAQFAEQLREAIRRGWGVHRLEPPWLLDAARRGLDASLGATRGRMSSQVTAGCGPDPAAPGGPAQRSYQPERLTVEVAARLAEVHPRTVRKWLTRGAVQSARGPRGEHLVDAGSLVAKISRSRKEHDE